MTHPLSQQSPGPMQRRDWTDDFAMRQAAGGGDIVDYIRGLERRIERLEAQLKTH
jgi:hypothetical protein